MFALGGIYVEIFKDVSFRLTPVSDQDALNMMQETKSSKLLTGFRGGKASGPGERCPRHTVNR